MRRGEQALLLYKGWGGREDSPCGRVPSPKENGEDAALMGWLWVRPLVTEEVANLPALKECARLKAPWDGEDPPRGGVHSPEGNDEEVVPLTRSLALKPNTLMPDWVHEEAANSSCSKTGDGHTRCKMLKRLARWDTMVRLLF